MKKLTLFLIFSFALNTLNAMEKENNCTCSQHKKEFHSAFEREKQLKEEVKLILKRDFNDRKYGDLNVFPVQKQLEILLDLKKNIELFSEKYSVLGDFLIWDVVVVNTLIAMKKDKKNIKNISKIFKKKLTEFAKEKVEEKEIYNPSAYNEKDDNVQAISEEIFFQIFDRFKTTVEQYDQQLSKWFEECINYIQKEVNRKQEFYNLYGLLFSEIMKKENFQEIIKTFYSYKDCKKSLVLKYHDIKNTFISVFGIGRNIKYQKEKEELAEIFEDFFKKNIKNHESEHELYIETKNEIFNAVFKEESIESSFMFYVRYLCKGKSLKNDFFKEHPQWLKFMGKKMEELGAEFKKDLEESRSKKNQLLQYAQYQMICNGREESVVTMDDETGEFVENDFIDSNCELQSKFKSLAVERFIFNNLK